MKFEKASVKAIKNLVDFFNDKFKPNNLLTTEQAKVLFIGSNFDLKGIEQYTSTQWDTYDRDGVLEWCWVRVTGNEMPNRVLRSDRDFFERMLAKKDSETAWEEHLYDVQKVYKYLLDPVNTPISRKFNIISDIKIPIPIEIVAQSKYNKAIAKVLAENIEAVTKHVKLLEMADKLIFWSDDVDLDEKVLNFAKENIFDEKVFRIESFIHFFLSENIKNCNIDTIFDVFYNDINDSINRIAKDGKILILNGSKFQDACDYIAFEK